MFNASLLSIITYNELLSSIIASYYSLSSYYYTHLYSLHYNHYYNHYYNPYYNPYYHYYYYLND